MRIFLIALVIFISLFGCEKSNSIKEFNGMTIETNNLLKVSNFGDPFTNNKYLKEIVYFDGDCPKCLAVINSERISKKVEVIYIFSTQDKINSMNRLSNFSNKNILFCDENKEFLKQNKLNISSTVFSLILDGNNKIVYARKGIIEPSVLDKIISKH